MAGIFLLALAAVPPVHAAAAAGPDARIRFSIPGQTLAAGLLQFGQQAHLSIVAPQDLIRDKMGAAVLGEMDVRTGLARMLEPSGLAFEFVEPTAVRILGAPSLGSAAKAAKVAAPSIPTAQPDALEEVIVTALRCQEPLA